METLGFEDVDEPTEAFIPVYDDAYTGRVRDSNDVFDANTVHLIEVRAPKYTYFPFQMTKASSKSSIFDLIYRLGEHDRSNYIADVTGWPKLLASMPSQLGTVIMHEQGGRFEQLSSLPHISGADKWEVAHSDVKASQAEYLLRRADGASITIGIDKDAGLVLDDKAAYTNLDQLLAEKGLTRKVIVSFRPDKDTKPIEVDVFLPFLRVHCPHHTGCYAEVTLNTVRTEERTLALEFPGLGLRGKQKLNVKYFTKYPATERCVKYVVPATLLIYFGQTLVNGVPVAQGTRFALSQRKDERIELPLEPEEDTCLYLPEDVVGEGTDRRALTDERDDVITDLEETEMTKSGILTAMLPLGGKSTRVGLSFTRSATIGFSLTTSLARHARYVKVPVDDPSGQREICWRTEF